MRPSIRSIFVVGATGLATWLAIAATLPAVSRGSAPSLALGGLPPSVELEAQKTADAIARGSASRSSSTARDMFDRVARAPMVVKGFSSLGLLSDAQGKRDEARRLFAYAHTLSRRDATTELWMIEDRVAAGDIDGALLHYDHGLRTSKQLRATLVPVLASASSEALVARPLGRILARKPPWRIAFAEQFIGEFENPVTASYLIQQLRLDPAESRERAIIVAAIGRLVSQGAYGDAHQIWRQSAGAGDAAGSLLVDGSFERSDRLPPFSWQLVDEPGLAGVIEPRVGAVGRYALSLLAQTDRRGTVARQLVLLRPGTYRLSGIAGQVPKGDAAQPSIALACANAMADPMLAMPLIAGSSPRRFVRQFVVPAGCRAQWLTISAGACDDARDQSPWIDALRIDRL